MAKITVCDICKKEGKTVEAKTYQTVKGHSELRLDVCESHRGSYPKKLIEYVQFVYKLLMNIELSEKDAKAMFSRTLVAR